MGEILIVGAGAIGGLLGARLAAAGERVTLVGRPAWRDAVRRDGLTVRLGEGEMIRAEGLRPCASVAEAADGRSFDWLIVTTRSFALPAALHEARAALAAMPPVVCFQNGVGSEAAAEGIVGARGVVAATITTAVTVEGATALAASGKGGIGLARWGEGPDPAPLAARLARAGFRVRVYDNARAMKWSKLLMNMLGNAASALLAWPPERIMGDPALYALELAALAEARAVMRVLGVRITSLPGYPVRAQMAALAWLSPWFTRPAMRRLIAGGRGGKRPSLALALAAGATETEVGALNGAVAAAGARLGVATPVNGTLTRLVEAVARGELPRDAFHGDPAALRLAVKGG